ncbi:hypothetical protein DVA67_011250 [Solirubrobacter sp. CPCC 204708]|uniref:Uncharacterized protein n=1 Tax=Solirubrobacter deserti TaxID=2282478 RepID=A0ABT4RHQ5_9ACTN|nr:hypothetical protein [Solirubrobacter deserti]MBE2316555.1 hypothetical protein [Solirubrobacter deserti]MDA0138089.1 hypothetical protein [Solirubrobacter deserti]
MSDPARRAHEQLGEELVAAAVRLHGEERAVRARRRRRRRGIAALAVTAVLGAGAVAGAARLIGVGEPLNDPSPAVPRYQPDGGPTLVAQQFDRERNVAWGVGVYTGKDGLECSIAGAVRGTQLGRIEGNAFRPYVGDYAGSCGDLSQQKLTIDILRSQGRSIVFGRVRPGTRVVVAEHDGDRRRAEPGAGGGYLFIFDGELAFDDVDVRPD